ncbi:cadmium resistance transporter [Microcoleus sp. FACHB-1515]|uniref:cadmium resistance transporter n=1 Tax=Cyanophyceae TaxID=3028117 RepID=UPI0016877B90|nr:cadmium resistance transporter [Microcoleus sp. FACHB-1515]MBD2092953.1 cadmium resistance transporter [Microcoleus sp. FACHB-1515]
MSELIEAAIAAVTAFAATNIDDIVVLMIFYAQVNSIFRPRHIISGQYLGFVVLIVASLPGFFGGFLLPESVIGLLGFLPIAIGIKAWFDRDSDTQDVSINAANSSSLLPAQTLQVAAVTIANGGDNVGIYLPLFASSNAFQLTVILSVFAIMIIVWCSIAAQLARHPLIAKSLTRYGHIVVPFVLIALGLYILYESGAYQLLLPRSISL